MYQRIRDAEINEAKVIAQALLAELDRRGIDSNVQVCALALALIGKCAADGTRQSFSYLLHDMYEKYCLIDK